jgi:hypothetical protein
LPPRNNGLGLALELISLIRNKLRTGSEDPFDGSFVESGVKPQSVLKMTQKQWDCPCGTVPFDCYFNMSPNPAKGFDVDFDFSCCTGGFEF